MPRADIGFVDLHRAREQLTAGQHHRAGVLAANALAQDVTGAQEQDAVRRLDALALWLSPAEFREAAAAVPLSPLPVAWRRVRVALAGRLKQREAARAHLKSLETMALREIAERLAPAFQALDALTYSYLRLRGVLADSGLAAVDDRLGRTLPADRIEHERHEIAGNRDAGAFFVMSMGVKARGVIVRRAVVEPSMMPRKTESRTNDRDRLRHHEFVRRDPGAFREIETVPVATGNQPPYDTVLRTAVLNPEGR